MKNKKGFTLIELLAVMVILGLILGVAIPNVIRILNNSRNDTYINDSKNLLSLAEYKYRSGKDIQKPSDGKCIVMSLEYLDNSEFEHAPHGGTYDKKRSYVTAKLTGNTTEYYVTLVEKISSEYKGVRNRDIADLNDKDNRNSIVENFNSIAEVYEGMVVANAHKLICTPAQIEKIYKLDVN